MDNLVLLEIVYIAIFAIGFVSFYYLGVRVKKIRSEKIRVLVILLFLAIFVASICIKNYLYNRHYIKYESEFVGYALTSFIGFIVSLFRESKEKV